jgi:hypothetical protein
MSVGGRAKLGWVRVLPFLPCEYRCFRAIRVLRPSVRVDPANRR